MCSALDIRGLEGDWNPRVQLRVQEREVLARRKDERHVQGDLRHNTGQASEAESVPGLGGGGGAAWGQPGGRGARRAGVARGSEPRGPSSGRATSGHFKGQK